MKGKWTFLALFLGGILVTSSCTYRSKNWDRDAINQDSLTVRKNDSALSKRYGNPNSPYRDETVFIKLMEEQLRSSWYSDTEKATIASKLNLALQNRPGHCANNFTYVTPDNEERQLHDIKAEHTLLFFYNPECPACQDAKTALEISQVINRKSRSGELAVLALYIDRDLDVWRAHLDELPQHWLQGHDIDEHIYKKGVYDVRAIPSLYLLDKDKMVLIKDATQIDDLEDTLLKF